MKQRRDRRVTFFLVAAIICFALMPPSDEYWYVGAATGVVYTLLAIAAELDARSRRSDHSTETDPTSASSNPD